MNKIEQIRDEKAEELVEALSKGEKDIDEWGIFTRGFNDCLALELPIKFAEWKENDFNNNPKTFELALKSFPRSFPEYKELYQYWITYIYKGE